MRRICLVLAILCLVLSPLGTLASGLAPTGQNPQLVPLAGDPLAETVVGQRTPATGTAGVSCGATAVAVHGSRAHVAFDTDLVVLDISTPSQPVLLGVLHLERPAIALAASDDGGHVFIAHAAEWDEASSRYRGGGMSVVDVSTDSPNIVGSYDAEGDMQDLVAAGGYAYLAYGYEGVHIVDVSEPTNPHLVGLCGVGDSCSTGHLTRLAVQDDMLFASFDSGYGGLTAISVADPAKPEKRSVLHPFGLVHGLAALRDHLYCGGAWLRVLNVSEARALSEIGSTTLCEGYVFDGDIAAGAGYVYVVTDPAGLHVVSIADPAAPRIAGSLPLAGSTRLARAGDYLFVTSDLGLSVVSVTNPANPTLVGRFSRCATMHIPLVLS